MNILTWNCCCGFTEEKALLIQEDFNPEILVVQECRQKDLLCNKIWKYSCWYGDYKDSDLGVAVFSSKYCISVNSINNNKLRYFVPFNLIDTNREISLCVIWTKEKEVNDIYIGQVIEGLKDEEYCSIISKSIVVGDFNSDINYANEEVKFNRMLSLFEDKNLKSAYHTFANCDFGKESIKTWKNYGHIDYCFLPKDATIYGIRFGNPNKWYYKKESLGENHRDHIPLYVDFDFGL